ncbi:sensor histidine kinase [Peptostreptococcus equinus]|uniref:histidine kinase n=1 Tax=Peptostreptococcus equinus TaxID=3003601 RepID=A0ABY7JRX8_9FIRM|nr:ATP-binding protein [Peptostreptococcus sp. CBA3647]WAW15606.1 ATP-binding protein [Peptostreptococcus sp. CBA3647]
MNMTLYLIMVFMILSWIISLMLYKQKKELNIFVRDLMNVSTKVKSMNFDTRMAMTQNIDNNRFAENYNEMIDMLDRTFEQVEDKNRQLNTIIRSVTNGILVVDISNRIFIINKPAKKILDIPFDQKVEGKVFSNIIKNKEILDFIEFNSDSKESVSRDLRMRDGKILKIKIDPIKNNSKNEVTVSSVINIEDITEKMKLESMRKDFAANVSHELKTPLTSIQGFIETLKENDDNISPEMRKRFLNIIDSESSRLKILINDILLLSSIEGGKDIKKEWINIEDINEEIFALLKCKKNENEIKLFVEYLNENEMFYTYSQYFKELLINLISNGIKYNKPGGYVKVTYYDDRSFLYISVEDNGIGIAEEDMHRIFERFYRVSKSRNKEIEGTGLGLAIIKHIIISLNGKIEVESKLGEGSKFTVKLPKVYKSDNS